MEIRFASKQDIAGIISLLRQVGQVHHEIRPDIFRPGCQKYDEKDLDILLLDKARPIFVAVDGNAVLGYCFCMVREFSGDGALTDRKEIYIDDLCVDESCRGRGIATALYRHTLEFAQSLGCAFVTLNVWCGNRGAMEFYEKMGLTPRSITLETKV